MSQRYLIFLILGFAAILRILLPVCSYFFANNENLFYMFDSYRYVAVANEFLNNKRFYFNTVPELERTPAYPLLIVLCSFIHNRDIALVIAQCILSCFTIFLIYKISIELFNDIRIALIGSFFYSIEPLSILYTSKIMTESLFTFLIMLFSYFLVLHLKSKKIKYIILSALFLSFSVYTRPIALFLNLLITLVFLFSKTKNKVKISLIFLLLSSSLISGWLIRNYVVANYIGFSSRIDKNIYFYNAAWIIAKKKNGNFYEERNKRMKEILTIAKNFYNSNGFNQRRYYDYLRQEGSKIILDDLPLYFSLHFKGVIDTLLNPGATEYLRMFNFNYNKAYEILGEYYITGAVGTLKKMFFECPKALVVYLLLDTLTFIYLFLVFFAVFKLRKNLNVLHLMLILTACYFLFLGPHGTVEARFKHPFMPFICIFAGYGAGQLCKSNREL